MVFRTVIILLIIFVVRIVTFVVRQMACYLGPMHSDKSAGFYRGVFFLPVRLDPAAVCGDGVMPATGNDFDYAFRVRRHGAGWPQRLERGT